MTIQFKPLIAAIDAQNLDQVEAFITQNPDLDYNCVTPGGLSALWIALYPPKGKPISTELLKFLLQYIKPNGASLVNPTQSLHRWRPIDSIDTLDQEQRQLLNTAENNYIAPEEMENPLNQNLGNIAADNQNTHNPLVVRNCDENTIRLFKQYSLNPGIEPATVSEAFQEINQFIQQEGHKQFTAHQLEMIKKSAKRCMYLNDLRTYKEKNKDKDTDKEELTFELTIAQLMALVWFAAGDSSASFIPEESQASLTWDRKIALLESLLQAQTAYGDNSPACEMGTRNQLAMALASMHKLVHAGLNAEVKLSGEVARYFMAGYFGRELQHLADSDRNLYWQIIRHSEDLDGDKAAEKAYINYIEDNKEHFKQVLSQRVEPTDVDQVLFTLEDDETFPLGGHRISLHTATLLKFLKAQPDVSGLFNNELSPDDAFRNALELTSHRVLNSPGWKGLCAHFALEGDQNDQEFVCSFIQYWLSGPTGSGVIQPDLNLLFKNPNMVKEYSEHCLFLVVWDRLRDPLIAAYPEQSMWLKHLKATEIIQLLAAYTTHYQIGNVTTAEGFSRLIQLALELRLGRNLCLKGRTFHDLNLRGMDLRGADLREARFVNCDWRGAVYNKQTQFDDAVFESCTITNLSDEELFVWQGVHRDRNLLHHEIGRDVKPPAIESLLTHPLLTPEAFNAKDANGFTILHTVAWHSNNTKLLSRLLNHPLCTKELFMETINSGQNILSHARPIMLSVLLNHPFCTHELLMKTNAYGLNPLMTNLIAHNYEEFKVLLLSSHCTRKVMEQPCEQDPRYQDGRSMYKGETLLSFSIRKQYLNAARKLVSYPESLAFLAKTNQAGIKNIDALKSLDHFSESLVIPQIQLMSRLADYASFSHRFFHGKWNHHHVNFVQKLLARDDLTYEVIGEQYALYKESLELQGKEFNHEGALAKIMQLLPEEVKQNLAENQVGHSVQA